MTMLRWRTLKTANSLWLSSVSHCWPFLSRSHVPLLGVQSAFSNPSATQQLTVETKWKIKERHDIRGSMCLLFRSGICSAVAGIVQTGRVDFVAIARVSRMKGKCVCTLWRALLASSASGAQQQPVGIFEGTVFTALWEAPLPLCEEGGDSIFIGNPMSLSHISPDHLWSNSAKHKMSFCSKINCGASFRKTANVLLLWKLFWKLCLDNGFNTTEYCMVFFSCVAHKTAQADQILMPYVSHSSLNVVRL